MNDFRAVKQKYYTLIIAESGGARLWAFDNWNNNLRRVDPDIAEDLIKEIERAGFTVGDK